MVAFDQLPRRWNPWRELAQLQSELSSAFGGFPRQRSANESNWPAVNIWKGEDKVAVSAELPGVEPDDIDVTVTKKGVVIRAQRQHEECSDQEECVQCECSSRTYERAVGLPFEVDPDTSEAVYEKGVLTLTLHRPEAEKPKKLTVKAG